MRVVSKGYYTPQQIECAIIDTFGVDTQLIADRTYYVAEAGGQLAGGGGWSKRHTLFGGDQRKAAPDPRVLHASSLGAPGHRSAHHAGV